MAPSERADRVIAIVIAAAAAAGALMLWNAHPHPRGMVSGPIVAIVTGIAVSTLLIRRSAGPLWPRILAIAAILLATILLMLWATASGLLEQA